MRPSQLVESYRFWDVVALWAAERLDNESVIARALARGVIVDGLRMQSIDPRWVKTDRSLTGNPYVGYAADPGKPPVLLRIEALEHLLEIVRRAATPSREILSEEFVEREHFRDWLASSGQELPSFWFPAKEGAVEV